MELWILVFIGFAATFFGTLAGSGGLISMPSMLLLGVPIHSAIAAAKFSNMFSSFSSFYVLLKSRKINLAEAIKTAPFALGGGIVGGIFANSISEQTMTIIAIILLSFALILTFTRKPSEKNNKRAQVQKDVYPYLFGIGTYDGMFGPGQASLLMYTYLHKGFSFLQAIAFTRFQTFLSCFGSFFSFVAAGNFQLEVGLYLAIGSFVGAQCAVRIADRLSNIFLKRLLHIITIVLIIQLTIRLIF